MWWFKFPAAPPIPDEALSRGVRLALGRAGALQAWESLWEKGVTIGAGIGRAEGAGLASFAWIAVILVMLAASKFRRSDR